MFSIYRVFIFGFSISLLGCGSSNVDFTAKQFGIFRVLDNDTTIEMSGETSSNTLDNFNVLIQNYPNVNRIEIVQCEGSSDDEVNLKVAKLVHTKGIETYLRDNGLIASGGVDFFLAGVKRSKGENTKIGVHSWSDGSGMQATAFPEGHANHLPYIEYYKSVGFTQENAEDFYYFTINAARAENIYYMSEAEIQRYQLLKD